MLSIENHIESIVLLLITKLRQYFIIFGRSWIKKHGVLLDIIYNFITLSSRFCMHFETFLSFIPFKPIKKTKKIFKAKQQQDIIPNRILKRGLIENLDDFLKIIEKISKKKDV